MRLVSGRFEAVSKLLVGDQRGYYQIFVFLRWFSSLPFRCKRLFYSLVALALVRVSRIRHIFVSASRWVKLIVSFVVVIEGTSVFFGGRFEVIRTVGKVRGISGEGGYFYWVCGKLVVGEEGVERFDVFLFGRKRF